MRFLLKILISSLAVLVTAFLLPGVHVDDYITALFVAVVLALFNAVLKPLLIILTIPVTIFTFGFFLLVINAFIIYLVHRVVPGFEVGGFWWAMGFSVLLSVITSIFENIDGGRRKRFEERNEDGI